jgi:hypothetical protein
MLNAMEAARYHRSVHLETIGNTLMRSLTTIPLPRPNRRPPSTKHANHSIRSPDMRRLGHVFHPRIRTSDVRGPGIVGLNKVSKGALRQGLPHHLTSPQDTSYNPRITTSDRSASFCQMDFLLERPTGFQARCVNHAGHMQRFVPVDRSLGLGIL